METTNATSHTTLKPAQPPPPAPELLSQIADFIANHLVCSPEQRTVLAIWVLHTHLTEASCDTGYLNIYSRFPSSGKTTCLELLRMLSARPLYACGGLN